MARSSLKNIIQMLEETPEAGKVESKFLMDLKHCIEVDEKTNKRKGSNYHKPSGMHCIRSMYYRRVDAPVDPDDTSYILIGICNSGTDTHERLQTYVSKMNDYGIDCEYVNVGEYVKKNKIKNVEVVSQCGMETKLFHKKLNMSFLCDGIIKYEGKYYILEIKTEMSTKWYNRRGVDPKHYDQATCYSEALGLEDVLFLYVNRDNLDLKTFMFHVTDELRNKMVTKIKECEKYVKKQLPPPKPDIEPAQCKKWYCPYMSQCRKDG